MRAIATAVVGLVLAAGFAAGAPLEVKLTVEESAGVAREAEPVSGGVPLPHGLVKDAAQVKLLDAAGKEVPAQFSAINRWGDDGSIMWLLVQSSATVPAKGTTTFILVPGPAAAARNLLKVNDGPDAVTIDTGKAKFVVSKRRFNLIDAAWLDANGDGKYSDDEQVVVSDPRGGSVLTLAADGGVYSSAAGAPKDVVIEETGPERATVLVRGLHLPESGKGTLPYLYGYVVRIRAYAGQPYIRVSYTLSDESFPAIGTPVCKDAAVGIGVKTTGDAKTGDGWMATPSGSAAAVLAVRYLKENAPASLQLAKDEKGARLTLKPWNEGERLDICSRKTYEMQVTLLPSKGLDDAGRCLTTFDNALRFWCPPAYVSSTGAWGDFGALVAPDAKAQEAIRKAFRPFTSVGWRLHGSTPSMVNGRASAPGGGYEPLLTDGAIYLGYMETGDRRYFDQLERTSWHWRDRRYIHLDQDFTEKRWEGAGGVYRAYLNQGKKDFPQVQPADYDSRYGYAWNYGGSWGPMDTSHFSVDELVNYYYLTGDRLTLDGLRMYGQEAVSFCNGFIKAGKTHVSRSHGWVTRALMSVYEATNDQRLLDVARGAVKSIRDNQDTAAGSISPVNERDRDGKPVTHTPFMAAAVAMALGRYYRHYPEEDVRDAFLGIADWMYYDVALKAGGFSYTWTMDDPGKRSGSGTRCMSTMSWAYQATGQRRYLEAADLHAPVAGPNLNAWNLSGFGQEYVNIKLGTRADAVPPAAVKDLAAEVLGGGRGGGLAVRLTWTAPGDNGAEGQAAEYQVKFARMEIKEHSDWRTEADKALSFWAATNVKGEPKPAAAGAKETFTVDGLAPGAYWFALKTYDRQPNQSDLSNVVKVEVK